MWVVLWNALPFLVAFRQDLQLSIMAVSYLHALQWSIFPALVYLVLRSFFAALGYPRWTVVVSAIAVPVNALLNWGLIGGHACLPALGLFGSGLATALSNVVMASTLGVVAVLDPRFKHFRIFTGIARPDWSGFGAFWHLSLPIGAGLLLETGMFAAATALVGQLDDSSLAAHAIAQQVATLMFMVPLGIGQAATIRVGRASASEGVTTVALTGKMALFLALAAMAISAVILLGGSTHIADAFLDQSDPGTGAVRAIAINLLRLAGLFQLADGAQVVLAGMLRGLRDTRAPMMIAGIGYWGIGLPLGGVLAFGGGLRAPGVWIGFTAGLSSVAMLLYARWHWMLRRGRQIASIR